MMLYARGSFGFVAHLERIVPRRFLATLSGTTTRRSVAVPGGGALRNGVRGRSRCPVRDAAAVAVATVDRTLGELHPDHSFVGVIVVVIIMYRGG